MGSAFKKTSIFTWLISPLIAMGASAEGRASATLAPSAPGPLHGYRMYTGDAGTGEGSPPTSTPGVNAHAIASESGAVWIRPTSFEVMGYDEAGNRISSSDWDYGWDAKNQLARARTKGLATAPAGYDITFTYDARGRRAAKHVARYSAGALAEETLVTFLWDGWRLIYERHARPDGTLLRERRYVWGPDFLGGDAGGVGGLLMVQEGGGASPAETLIPLYDGSGNVTALANPAGDLLASYAYGPFGEAVRAAGTHAAANPWRYSTNYFDEETGLYYFGYRYYDPSTATWLSRDPLGEAGGLNLYAYCGNDPVNNFDYLGLDFIYVHHDGVVKWVVENNDRWGTNLSWVPIGRVSVDTEELAYGAGRGRIYGNSVTLDGGGTVNLGDLKTFAKRNPTKNYSVHWFNKQHEVVAEQLAWEYRKGSIGSTNGMLEFLAGVHDRGGDFTTGITGLVARDGLLGSGFFDWGRWTAPSENLWAELYGNSVFRDSPSQIREQRGWKVSENSRFYGAGGDTVDIALIAGPIAWTAWTKFVRAGAAAAPKTGGYKPGDILPDGRIAGMGPGASLNNQAAREAAKALKFKPVKGTPFNSHGQPVFKKGNRYLTPDVDQHSGGVWKMFDQKGRRLGTYDGNLNRIGK